MTGTSSLPGILNKLDKFGPCLLCRNSGERVRSHIYPQFMSRYLRATSATGYLRTTAVPNKRVQAGPWDYLLCQKCEALFSRWESDVAKKVFRPLLNRQKNIIRYYRWLPMFGTSLTWRVLAFYRAHPETQHEFIKDWSVTDGADAAWRDCLLGHRPHPGEFEQHLIPFDYIVNKSGKFPLNINRYLMRSFDCDIMSNGEETLVYCKLMNLMFFGLINFKNPKAWRGTKLGFNGGVIGHSHIVVPRMVMKDILIPKAEFARKVQEGLSLKQQNRIADNILRDPGRSVRSATFEAFEYDLRLSGRAVFHPGKKDD